MGATENIVERLSSVQSWSRFCLSWQRNAREQLRTVYAKELTQQLVKNNFFVLPVCLSELLPFAALNSTCMSARVTEMTGFFCVLDMKVLRHEREFLLVFDG